MEIVAGYAENLWEETEIIAAGRSQMPVDKKGMLKWCDSIEETFQPSEKFSPSPQKIPEMFIATAIRYIRALCAEGEFPKELDYELEKDEVKW
jgi:hypothetical protein